MRHADTAGMVAGSPSSPAPPPPLDPAAREPAACCSCLLSGFPLERWKQGVKWGAVLLEREKEMVDG